MLSSIDLEEEIIESLIETLRIPNPSESVPNRQQVLFPAHIMGLLLNQLLVNKMVDRIRDLFGNVVTCKFLDLIFFSY
jgi:hypothetical protein